MKFYLSSYHLSNNPDKLLQLFTKGDKVAVISNALDFSTDFDRLLETKNQEVADLKRIGLNPKILDLRDYFHQNKSPLEKELDSMDGIWITGGNTFLLRRAMSYSGFDTFVSSLPSSFVYSGYSAGVCVATPTLKGLELVDDPSVKAEGYDEEIIWEGLHLLEFCIAPHYKSSHPESLDVDKLVEYYQESETPFRTLKDGEEIVLE